MSVNLYCGIDLKLFLLCVALSAQRVSKMSFQDFLEQTLTQPLGVSGEFYVGVPPGEQ